MGNKKSYEALEKVVKLIGVFLLLLAASKMHAFVFSPEKRNFLQAFLCLFLVALGLQFWFGNRLGKFKIFPESDKPIKSIEQLLAGKNGLSRFLLNTWYTYGRMQVFLAAVWFGSLILFGSSATHIPYFRRMVDNLTNSDAGMITLIQIFLLLPSMVTILVFILIGRFIEKN